MHAMNHIVISVLFKNVFLWVISLAILCGPLLSHAIVSMEDVHLGKPPVGFSGSFDLDFAFVKGNSEQIDTATGLKVQWSQDKVTDFILMSYEYGESSGLTNKNKNFVHYRHIHQLDSQLAWEAFSQFSSDEFTNLTLRALIGGGVRLSLGEVTDESAVLIGMGLFYEREKLDTLYADESNTENTLRASTYLVLKYRFNAHVSLLSTTYFQPGLSEFSDFRATEDLSLVSMLGESMSIKISIDVAHDSEPPRDIKQTDSSIKAGIVVNF